MAWPLNGVHLPALPHARRTFGTAPVPNSQVPFDDGYAQGLAAGGGAPPPPTTGQLFPRGVGSGGG